MRKFLLFILFTPFSIFSSSAQNGTTGPQIPGSEKTNWIAHPFDHQVFIENKGQFTTDGRSEDKILYGAQLGNIYAFITNHGIIYKYTERQEELPTPDKKRMQMADPDELDLSKKPIPHYLTATWEGSNNNVTIVAGEEQTNYYTYPSGEKGTIKASIFKKITCLNVYPNIDVEYIFPKGKSGIKYTYIVHPGGDLSLIKLKYTGAKNIAIDNDGNVQITADWGKFTDHAPVSYYQEDHNPVASPYQLNNDVESFSATNLDATKTLMVDPWSTNWTDTYTGTSGYDGAYDIDFDYAGNVYIYGAYNPYQLAKYNSKGVQQWTYNTTNFRFGYYGDFCVDKASGVSFAFEGFGGGGNAQSNSITTSGALLNSFNYKSNTSLDEQWRVSYDLCDHIILIAGGGISATYQAATLDTNLVTYNLANVLSLGPGNGYHDMALIATDPILAEGYMATTRCSANASSFDNDVLQMPLPALLPVGYITPDNYSFRECYSPKYVGFGNGCTNGMNGMALSPNWLYMYDGFTLSQCVKNLGTLNNSVTLTGSSYDWGGLDVDLCDDIYAGSQTNVELYNASLKNTGSIGPFPDNVYDVVIGNGLLSALDSTLYVCGKGFVSSIKIDPPHPPIIVKSRTHVCSCNCTATGTLNFCGNPDTTNVTYLWSNGQTTHTATGLCPGNTYTLTIKMGCSDVYQDTVIIPNGGLLTTTKSQTSATCSTPGSATITVTSGTAPYTYAWTNGGTTSSISGLGAGNYCVSVTDSKGCQDSVCFVISGSTLPTIAIAPNPDTLCVGNSVGLTASGGVTYTWLPAAGLSCTSCANPTANPNTTTTYTVTGTDNNGCKNKDSVIITVNPLPTISVTAPHDTICIGGSDTLTAAGAVTYSWLPATGLSCSSCSAPIANPTTTTTYTVTGTDAHGCINTTTFTLHVAELPAITATASNRTICEGTSVNLLASGSNITSSFTWQPGPFTGAVVAVTPSVTTTYTVSASNGCGTATAFVTIYVNQLPVTAFGADNLSGCSPFCVQFRNKSISNSGNIIQWRWDFGNGDSSNAQNPIYCYPKPGNYPVTLTTVTDSGCSSTLNKLNYITVYSHPVAAFTLSPQPTDVLQGTIQFTDQSTDAYGLAYWTWNFGVTGNDTLNYTQNPTYTYWDTGTYCPSEVVMNIHGCVDTTTNCLVIDPIFALYIPDAFTPNGNHKNDIFMAKGNDVKSFEMYIFDRWGQQLFHSTDINKGWDGSKGGGTICEEDTYVYLINAYDNKNHKHSYLGKISLIK